MQSPRLRLIKPPYSEISLDKAAFMNDIYAIIKEDRNSSKRKGMIIKIDSENRVNSLTLTMKTTLKFNELHILLRKIPTKFPYLEFLGLEIYGLKTIPKEFQSLNQLKHLVLSNPFLEYIDDSLFLKLSKLEYLAIRGNFDRIPSSLDSLQNLESLMITKTPKLEYLPESIGNLEKLKVLKIFFAPVKSLPQSIGTLKSLAHLMITEINVITLPYEIGNCRNLESISIEDCHKLEHLPESIAELTNLRKLIIRFCSSLKQLPINLPPITRLERI